MPESINFILQNAEERLIRPKLLLQNVTMALTFQEMFYLKKAFSKKT